MSNDQNDSWPDFLPPPSNEDAGRSYNPHYEEQNRQAAAASHHQSFGDRFWHAPRYPDAQQRPAVTTALIAVCFAVWVVQVIMPTFTGLVALNRPLTSAEPWRIFTSTFAHGGLTHIACNMLTLWIMGKNLEPILGRAKFLALYLVSTLGGSACFLILADPMSSAVGASGAIFGLFGTYAVIYRAMRMPMASIWTLLGVNLVITLISPGIAWQAHLGGLIAGAGASAAIFYELKTGKKVAWLGIGVIAVALAALSYVALRIGI